ncbi:CidA/LrgA family protein [uncultured Moraxella sp.]|uniref:CidA/LrgA family protein n=1 Tax=uncultured Moraxella sp. TaxID=263769 RepID=UPI0025D35235|nr:CidA/LrgA family protein [uncultured Moraxella sp.]
MKIPVHSAKFWLGMLATIIIVVAVRELALVVCTYFGMPTAANIVGLVSLFIVLISVRMTIGLPEWLSYSSSVLLVDSGFAFLPVSAGAGILLFGLGADLLPVSAVIIISTLIPLWAFAKLSAAWLKGSEQDKG